MSISKGFLQGTVVAATLLGAGIAQADWLAIDPATAQISKTLETSYDADGNPTRVLISQQVKRADGVVETMTTLNENTYLASDYSNWRLGQVSTVKATHTQDGSTVVKESQLIYAANGAVDQEVLEPNQPDFKVVTRYVLDAWGNATTKAVRADFSTDPAKRVPEVAAITTYDSTLHLFPVSTSNALGHTASRSYDFATGNLLSETGINGLTVRYQYDLLGRMLASMAADGTKVITEYASCEGNPLCAPLAKFFVHSVTVKDPDNALATSGAPDTAGTPLGPNVYTHFDVLRRQLSSFVETLDGRFAVTGTKELNAKGQVVKSAEPWFSGDTLQWTTFTYDVYGRVVKATQPKGTSTTVTYAPLKTTYTNELGQKKIEELGLQGKPIKLTEGAGSTSEASTQYSYDALGRMLSITDAAGKLRSYSYDQAGNKLTDNDPNQGAWTYRYDSLGRLISQTDAKNQTTGITYDVLGRVISRAATDFNSQWAYDTAVNGKGKLATATASNGYARTHSYDSLGRPVATTTTVDNQSYTLSTTYDALGRAQSMTYPTGFTYQNEYNARGFLTKVKSQDGQRIYWQVSDSTGANGSDAAGHILKASLGNGVVVNRSYDPKTGQLSAQWAGNNAGTNNVQNETYLFNDTGNLQSRSDNLSNLSETFQYDGLNRLSSATVLGQAAQTLQYDKVGNITFKSDIGYYRYDVNHPQAVASVCRTAFAGDGSCSTPYATYSYDINGNVNSGGGRDYTWNAFNKPLTLSRDGKSESFAYDADYERIKHVHTDGSTTLYINPRLDSGAHFEINKKGSSTEYTHHVYAGGEAVAAIVTLNTGAEVNKLSQDFSAGLAGITLPSSDPAGTLSWDASGKRLAIKTRNYTSDVVPAAVVNNLLATSEGVKLKADVVLGVNAGSTGGRYFSVALNNNASAEYSVTGLRDIRALFSGGQVYVQRTLREADGSVRQATTTAIGAINDNSTYTLEMEAHDSGVNVFVYPKGTARAQGYSYRGHLPQMGGVRLHVVGRAGPAYGESVDALDNLSVSSGGITVTKDAPYERYLHKDHLGSIVATTDNQGTLLERFSYDAWGKRRKLNGQSDVAFDTSGTGNLPAQSTHHGFTGHEMLDDMSLVHMNGRIYDPLIGRFISADPNIDTLYSTQGLNSYSYVMNNPLNATDPTGYWSFKKHFKRLGSSLNSLRKKVHEELTRPVHQVIRVLGPQVSQAIAAGGSYFCGPGYAACYAAASYEIARANGADTLQGLRIGAINGATAYAAQGITTYSGTFTTATGQATAYVGLNAVRGGVTSVAMGGDFRSGFASGAFSAGVGYSGLGDSFVGGVIAGGVGSTLTGGKFSEGVRSYFINQALAVASMYYEKAVGFSADARPGEIRENMELAHDANGRLLPQDRRVDVIGKNLPGKCFGCQGGLLSVTANVIPGMNAFAGLHDYWLAKERGVDMTWYNNVPSMPPAMAVTAAAILGNYTRVGVNSPLMYTPILPRNVGH